MSLLIIARVILPSTFAAFIHVFEHDVSECVGFKVSKLKRAQGITQIRSCYALNLHVPLFSLHSFIFPDSLRPRLEDTCATERSRDTKNRTSCRRGGKECKKTTLGQHRSLGKNCRQIHASSWETNGNSEKEIPLDRNQ